MERLAEESPRFGASSLNAHPLTGKRAVAVVYFGLRAGISRSSGVKNDQRAAHSARESSSRRSRLFSASQLTLNFGVHHDHIGSIRMLDLAS